MQEKITRLLHKLVNGIALDIAEQKDIDEWVAQSEENRTLYEEVMNKEAFRQEVKEMLEYDGRPLWKKISSQLPPATVVPFFRNRRFLRYAAAVILLAFISTTVYYIFLVKPTEPQQEAATKQQPQPDVAPGTERAILVLDNGTELALDHTSNGKIAEEGHTVIMKEDGLLAYNSDARKEMLSDNVKVFYNTLTTPKAGYYSSLVLADGSKVWLDAQSSIHFPTSFPGNDREVEISGQVYFEVAKNAKKPFKVKVKNSDMEVEVLGTHFNINAYKDEGGIRTSLLEGSVKVKYEMGSGKSEVVIEPGEQVVAMSNGKLKVESDADMEEVMAWKNGNFLFKKEDLETIMRQVARWYDVEVVFEEPIPGHFVASLPRNVSVSRLLEIFEMAGGVRFEIDDANKRITVRR